MITRLHRTLPQIELGIEEQHGAGPQLPRLQPIYQATLQPQNW